MAVDLYYVKELVGNEGMPGAPLLHLACVVNSSTGVVNGQAQVTQAIAPPNGEIDIPHVTGQIRHLGFGQDSMIVSLSGKYLVSFPPPAIGSYLADFNSVLNLDPKWHGTGSFTYGQKTIDDVPAEPEE